MRTWSIAALAAGAALGQGVLEVAKDAGQTILDIARAFLTWHRSRMQSDPLYPVALAAGGGALIQLFVPSLSVSNALRTVLHTLLGTSTPGLYGGRYGAQEDRWEDD
jgi:hypothetical protein